jgi:hypothetical protein
MLTALCVVGRGAWELEVGDDYIMLLAAEISPHDHPVQSAKVRLFILIA